VTLGDILGVTAVGVVVGVDLVSVPQAMTARPLVAGFVGGWIAGSPVYGLLIGAVLELFALETLPVGASRYPDWGPPSVAAGALFQPGPGGAFPHPFWPWLLSLVLVSALVAWFGGWALDAVHRANGAAISRRAAALEAGDPRALILLQAWGFVRDAGRAAALTLVALLPGGFVARVVAEQWRAPTALAEDVALAVAVGVAAAAAWRLFGRGKTARWLLAGVSAGLAVALL
jgi:PTS system mannose-specific IIC component